MTEGSGEQSGRWDEKGPIPSFPERREYDSAVPPLRGKPLPGSVWEKVARAELAVYREEIREIAQNATTRIIAHHFFKAALDEAAAGLSSVANGEKDPDSLKRRIWDPRWVDEPSYVSMGRLNIHPPLADLVWLLDQAVSPDNPSKSYEAGVIDSSLSPGVIGYVREAWRAHVFRISLIEVNRVKSGTTGK